MNNEILKVFLCFIILLINRDPETEINKLKIGQVVGFKASLYVLHQLCILIDGQ